MNAIALTLGELHRGEENLERALRAAAERHGSEVEVHHVALDLARWSREHSDRLAALGPQYGTDGDGTTGTTGPTAGEAGAGVAGGGSDPPDLPDGLVLLRDLGRLHLAAVWNSLHWEMLAQAAQATRDQRLLEACTACHPQTIRQMKWANTMIKNLSPQVLSSL
ncbi:hypothetical protein AB0F11_26280 [Streptomyces sp. NPDC032472]|uniref:hypothetical protein n=1 Tax=Streptomyces sp. NPDC032472 TaxID=3155018 RepID=UPI0033FA4491